MKKKTCTFCSKDNFETEKFMEVQKETMEVEEENL